MAEWRMGLAIVVVSFAVFGPVAHSQAPSGKKSANVEAKVSSTLASEVRHQLQVLPYCSVFDHIDFALKGATVTLTGQVLRRTLKESAEAEVRTLEGIAAVRNQIEVLPASPEDNELRRTVYRAIYEDPILGRYAVQTVPPIHIIVKNGNVALEGFVNSAGDKNLAGAKASGVARVASVKNNLMVQGQGRAGQ